MYINNIVSRSLVSSAKQFLWFTACIVFEPLNSPQSPCCSMWLKFLSTLTLHHTHFLSWPLHLDIATEIFLELCWGLWEDLLFFLTAVFSYIDERTNSSIKFQGAPCECSYTQGVCLGLCLKEAKMGFYSCGSSCSWIWKLFSLPIFCDFSH